MALIFRMSPSRAHSQLDEAARMLARAFYEGSLFKFAFPEPRQRSRILPIFFKTIVEDAVRFGRVEVAYSGQITGLLIWYPPGRYPMTMARILRFLRQFLLIAAIHPVGTFKLFHVQLKLNRLRPKEPHCHGYYLGGCHGEHIGAQLIPQALNEIDANEWPVYLETQEERATKLYARFGFRMIHEKIETIPGGPPTWTMWRGPRAGVIANSR